jgi:hypothetical protein
MIRRWAKGWVEGVDTIKLFFSWQRNESMHSERMIGMG